MEAYRIRLAKALLSEIVRDAAVGVCSIVTVNRKPVAMIGPLPAEIAEKAEIAEPAEVGKPSVPPPTEDSKPLSDAAAFRKALFGAPYPLALDF